MRIWANRIIKFVLMAVCFSCVELGINRWAHAENAPAGFTVGIVDGVLMPMAMPALMAGKDMPIYAIQNSGRTYKLGYTMGVNGCGAIFFGMVFWRVSRWHKARNQRPASTGQRNPKNFEI